MMTLERLPKDLRKGIDIHLHTHCYRVTEQGVIMMKISVIDELRMYDLPRHSKSTATVISGLLTFVDELINKKKSVDPIPVPEKSVVEKPTHNPCKDLPTYDVVNQDTIWPFQAEFVNPKFSSKSTETISSTSMLGGNIIKAKVPVAPRPV